MDKQITKGITNKYQINQELWVMSNNKACKVTVNTIHLPTGGTILYSFPSISGAYLEKDCFESKDELLKSL